MTGKSCSPYWVSMRAKHRKRQVRRATAKTKRISGTAVSHHNEVTTCSTQDVVQRSQQPNECALDDDSMQRLLLTTDELWKRLINTKLREKQIVVDETQPDFQGYADYYRKTVLCCWDEATKGDGMVISYPPNPTNRVLASATRDSYGAGRRRVFSRFPMRVGIYRWTVTRRGNEYPEYDFYAGVCAGPPTENLELDRIRLCYSTGAIQRETVESIEPQESEFLKSSVPMNEPIEFVYDCGAGKLQITRSRTGESRWVELDETFKQGPTFITCTAYRGTTAELEVQ